jgi:hypothetical protein
MVLLSAFVSCKKENAGDCFKANGKQTAEIRYTGKFRVIRVFDKIDVTIKQGTEYKIEIYAGTNLLSNIITVNKNEILSIKNANKCNFVRGYKRGVSIIITAPSIEKVDNEGVGIIKFDDGFVQDTIVVRAENSGDFYVAGKFNQIRTSSHGNGDVYIKGECNSLKVFSYGTNYTRCEDLKIHEEVFVETISIGHCYLNAPEGGVLACNIWRSGNVYYKGNPAIIANYSDGSASGKLIKQ